MQAIEKTRLEVSEEDKHRLRQEIFYININRAKFYSIGLIAVHVILLVIDVLRLMRGELAVHDGYRYLFYLHIILTAGLILFLVLFYASKIVVPGDIKNVHRGFFISFFAFLLLIAASISSIDQLIHAEITVYVIGILALAVGAYLPFFHRLVLFIPAHILVLLGVSVFQTDTDILIGNYINSTLVFLIALSLSQLMYRNFKKTFFAQAMIQKQQEKLEKLSLEDSLTGLRNRRYIDTKLFEEWDRAVRYDRDLSIAFADLDNFKQVNDTFGHNVGDEVLKVIGLILRGSIRGVDSVARYGGEEFLLLLPETKKDQAIPICEKVRTQIMEYPWTDLVEGLQVTISLGVADQNEADSIEAFLDCADKRLYKAKNAGKNQTCGKV